jgi:hypothetical protein
VSRWWRDRRASRNVALGAGGLGLLALVTANATSFWFGLITGLVGFAVAVVFAAHARAWSTFAAALALLLFTAVFGFVVLAASSVTWAPF